MLRDGDTKIDENITNPNDATTQDSCPQTKSMDY